ncbi:phage tail tape measure protein, TP901 family [Methylobacterium sp. 4-46]|uniref:phage tail tape measure protein n=1 Tax=unclassified Methylobacterium TaxID=2615210 RepID=UPI000152E8A3|nr:MULTISPECIES: phage tail tape measure protein [Methylobacterium]ACA18484.1 phage tail tape measure protein, TP901 family [Methylobacterium sp. 4-46]WFT77772.1 phage tail tape measure protein [Methylobacterium nodulans]
MASKTASLIIRLTDQVTGPAGQASKALQGLSKAGDGLNKLKNAASGLDELGGKLRRAKGEVERASRELAAAERKVAFFARSKASGSSNYAAFKASGEVDAAQARLRAAKAQFAASQRTLEGLKTTFDGQKAVVRGLTATLASAAGGLKQVTSAEGAIAGATNGANAALRTQGNLFSTISQRAASAAKAYRDVAAGMAAAGRQSAAQQAASRRMIDGMSSPARAARAQKAAQRQAELAATYQAGRRYSTGSMAGGAARKGGAEGGTSIAGGAVEALEGLGAAELAKRTYEKARDVYLDFDEATRRQRAVMGISEDTQRPLTTQALQIGKDTRFTNSDVVKAQTLVASSLPDHLKTVAVISAITENTKDYALAMGTTMDEGAEAIISRIKGRQYDLSSPDAAATSAKHAANRLVQFGKSSGASHHDIMGYTKFGAAPGQVMGFSEEFSDSLAAQLKRLGYDGAMAGTFVRAAATKLTVPTNKGRNALAAAGFDHDDYVSPGKKMSADNLDNLVRLQFGKGLNASQLKRIGELLNDEDVVGDRAEFVPQVSEILQETLAKKGKKGKVNAQDAQKIAKAVNDYMNMTSGAVDSERLLMDILKQGLTPALAKYLFGQEHGGRALGLRPEMLEKDRKAFEHTPKDRASQFGKDVNAGAYGEYNQMKGSFETAYMRAAQANDERLRGMWKAIGDLADKFSDLSDSSIRTATDLATATTAFLTLKGTLSALGMFGVRAAEGLGAILSKITPFIAAAYAGAKTGQAIGEGINEVGAIAGGKYWTPKDEEELADLRRQRDEKRGQIEARQAKFHPSRRGEFDPESDRLQKDISVLENRIRSGEETKRAGLPIGEAAREALDARAAAKAAPAAPPVKPPEVKVPDAASAGQDAGKAVAKGVEKGADKAGEQAGQAIADGVRAKAPEAKRGWEMLRRDAAEAGSDAGQSAGERIAEGINEVGAIAAGKHWTPKDSEEVAELRQQRDAKRAEMTGIEGWIRPSMRGQPNADLDRLQREVQTLDNRIRAGEERQRAGLKLGEAAREALASKAAAGSAESGAKAGQEAGQAIADGIRAKAPEAGSAGQEAGSSAGQGVAKGGAKEAPKIEEKAKSLWEKIKEIFSEPIKISFDLDTGAATGRARSTYVSLSGGGGGSFFGRALAVGGGAGIGHVASKADRAAYIREAARRNGIDPEVALRVAQSEGFNEYTGDQGRSFGDFQLFTGGGLGNKALREGINVRDPNTWREQIDFAMREAAKGGWTPWHGAKRVGIGPWQGIGRPRTSAPAASGDLTPAQIEAARQRIQSRYTPRPASPEAQPGLTGSGVPAIAPKGDTSGLDSLGTKADAAKDKLSGLSGVTVSPQVSTGGLDGLIAKANQALAALQRIPGAVASANASLGSVNAAAGGKGGGESGSGSVNVRGALSDNFA